MFSIQLHLKRKACNLKVRLSDAVSKDDHALCTIDSFSEGRPSSTLSRGNPITATFFCFIFNLSKNFPDADYAFFSSQEE